MGYNVTVDVDKCVGCGECVDICPVGVYEMKDGKSDPVNADECVGCESCIEVCEGHCITVEEQQGWRLLAFCRARKNISYRFAKYR